MLHHLLDATDPTLYDVTTHAKGPAGKLPLDSAWLIHSPSGDVFGWTMDTGMGVDAVRIGTQRVSYS